MSELKEIKDGNVRILVNESEGGFRLVSLYEGDNVHPAPLDEGGWATIYRIQGTRVMLNELGYPEKVINLFVHQHLMGQHQLRFTFPRWESLPDEHKEGFVEMAEECDPPDYGRTMMEGEDEAETLPV